MSALTSFFALVDAYRAATKRAESTLASDMFNDGKGISRVRAGKDIGVRRLARAIEWLDDNWPENAEWPRSIDRPSLTKDRAA